MDIVQQMPRLLFVSPFRFSTLTLFATLLIALAGLFAIDRALAAHERVEAEVQAVETSALIRGFLAVHAEALQSVRLLYIAGDGQIPEGEFAELVSPMLEYASAFRRIWVTDADGVVQHEHNLTVPPLPPETRVDTLARLEMFRLAERARTTRRTQISRTGALPSGEQGFAMLEPLFAGDRFLGFSGGSITSEALLEHVLRRPDRRLHEVMIISANDTIAALRWDAPRAFARSASASLVAPGGMEWTVLVTRTVASPLLRVTIWFVGLVVLSALFVALTHERRQGVRLAERTAELERLSAELLRANRAKSEFLANVSHELRTPLNAIVGFVDLLRDGVYGELGGRQLAPMERIASSAAHLRALVDQVLDIAKMAAGRLEVDREAIDLRPFVLDLVSEVEALATERGLSISVAVGGALPRVYTDRTHLRQILINLLGNAVKFTDKGGVAVRAYVLTRAEDLPRNHVAQVGLPAPDRPWIAVQVADTGVGIDPADQDRIFEEFEQVNAGSRSDSAMRGTGLGLSISRRLARLLGGDLTVDSAPGRGATFTVWLPIGEDRAQLAGVDEGVPALSGRW